MKNVNKFFRKDDVVINENNNITRTCEIGIVEVQTASYAAHIRSKKQLRKWEKLWYDYTRVAISRTCRK